MRADEPVSRSLELVDLEDASFRIHDPVLADAVASGERGLGNAISQNGPGREDLDDKIRWTLDRALGDDRFPASGEEDQIRLHDRRGRENDVYIGLEYDAAAVPTAFF